MNNEQLNSSLYNKLNSELQSFIHKLQNSTPEAVIEQAYELVIKEDIVMSFECEGIDSAKCRALLREKKPLQKLFEKWEKSESRHMQEIRDVIDTYASELAEKGEKIREAGR